MIGHLSLKTNEILRMSRIAVGIYCQRYGLPVISVKLGTVDPKSFAEYSIINNCILLSSNANVFLAKHSPDKRVWWLNNYIMHELTHYKQRILLGRLHRPLTSHNFDDGEARREGEHYADSILGTYSTKDINPKDKVNPIDLYKSFHGVPVSRKTKVYYEPPPREIIAIGDLRQINYQPRKGKHKSTEFYHKSGDVGTAMLKTNLILATDKAGKHLYLVRKTRNSKYPVFTDRGIIG